jgi:hypothetical protein
MRRYPIKHAVSFHGSIAKAEDFKTQQDLFSQQHPEFSPLETYHVSGAMPTARRSKIIHEFAKSPSSLITNAKCLTEGVDVPKIDAVLFADPRRSTVDIVQAVGRALRKSPGKKSGYVILPLFTGDATGDAILESDEFKEIIQTLRALASNDERIVEYFRAVSKGNRPRGKLIEFDIDVKATADFDAETLVRELELRTWNRLAKLNWRPFEEAREFVRGLGLRGQADWFEYAKSQNRPADIPYAPDRTYAMTGWVNWGDWLATFRSANFDKVFLSFEEARMFARKLNLKSGSEWESYCRSGQKPENIPASPAHSYRGIGWLGMGDWLGTGTIATYQIKYRSFESARAYAREQHLTSAKKWLKFSKTSSRPRDIPANPNQVYSERGWAGWPDWLGSDKKRPRKQTEYMRFEDARKFVRALRLKSGQEWRSYCKLAMKPENIPGNPEKIYKEVGWLGLDDWLDSGRIPSQKIVFRKFEIARKYVRSLKLKNTKAWHEYCQSSQKPADIPANPQRTYRLKGWTGWGDWLATGNIAPVSRKFREFSGARNFVRKLNIKDNKAWREYCTSSRRPIDIPTNPNTVYANRGWLGWGDWLGTENTSNAKRKFVAFEKAREYARSLNMKDQKAWQLFSKSGKLPVYIPTAPQRTYRGKGWLSWGHWLGNTNVHSSQMEFRPFLEARQYVRSLRLKRKEDWYALAKAGKKPIDIPRNPDAYYMDAGWENWADFLGKAR